jgi:Zn-dependent protease
MDFSQIDFGQVAFLLIAFLFAISVHESAHAWMANRCGDPTARMLGRITLNPIPHVEPFGTILLPIVSLVGSHFGMLFGWAKPTPVDPRNFKRPVLDDILTSVVGPASNFVIATASLVLLALISSTSSLGHQLVANAAAYQYRLLTPPSSALTPLVLFLYTNMGLNILLGVFNLIPIPPLDGSHVLRHFLAEPIRRAYDTFGMFGLLLLMLRGQAVMAALINPPIRFFDSILAKF